MTAESTQVNIRDNKYINLSFLFFHFSVSVLDRNQQKATQAALTTYQLLCDSDYAICELEVNLYGNPWHQEEKPLWQYYF
jgi:hypothetical protein